MNINEKYINLTKIDNKHSNSYNLSENIANVTNIFFIKKYKI
jgi:hypothetical protein